MNGGFETPKIPATGSSMLNGTVKISNTTGSRWIGIDTNTSGLYWKTTDEGIEIANGQTANGAYHTTRDSQFAELNYKHYGAIYQDVLTYPGEVLYWSFEHSGRNYGETMQLIIDNVTKVKDNWNPANQVWTSDDVQVTATDGQNSWNTYNNNNKPYVVPAGQYVTRFYFVSCDGMGSSYGNLLDNVTFSTTPVSPIDSVPYTINYILDNNTANPLSTDTGNTKYGNSIYPTDVKVDAYSALYDADAKNPTGMKITDVTKPIVMNLYYTTPKYSVEYYVKGSGTNASYQKVTDSNVLNGLTTSGSAVYGTEITASAVNDPDTLTINGTTYTKNNSQYITMTKGADNVVKVYYAIPHTVTYQWAADSETPASAELPATSNPYFENQPYSVDGNLTAGSTVEKKDQYLNTTEKWTFSGWKLNGTVVSGDQVMGNDNVTLVGSWQHETVTVSQQHVYYDWGTNAPDGVTLPTNSNTYEKGQSYPIDSRYTNQASSNINTYDQYLNLNGTWTFSGWQLNGTVVTDDQMMGSSDVTLHGVWTYTPVPVDAHSIYYRWGDNAPSQAVLPTNSKAYVKGQSYTEDIDTEYSNQTVIKDNVNHGTWTFKGWNDPNGGEMGTSDITLTGVWTFTPDTYTVTFLDYDSTVIATDSSYHYGDSLTAPADPSRAADDTFQYQFAGWDAEVADTVTGNFIYRAVYTKTARPFTPLTPDTDPTDSGTTSETTTETANQRVSGRPSTPKTGDQTNLPFAASGLAISLLAVLAVVLTKKKYSEE